MFPYCLSGHPWKSSCSWFTLTQNQSHTEVFKLCMIANFTTLHTCSLKFNVFFATLTLDPDTIPAKLDFSLKPEAIWDTRLPWNDWKDIFKQLSTFKPFIIRLLNDLLTHPRVGRVAWGSCFSWISWHTGLSVESWRPRKAL